FDRASRAAAESEPSARICMDYLAAGTGVLMLLSDHAALSVWGRSVMAAEPRLDGDGQIVASVAVALAHVFQAQFAEAEKWAVRALAISEKALRSDHPDIANALNNLAVLYERQGRYAEAEERYLRALAISEKVLPSDHPDIANSLHNLAALYERQG